MFWKLVAESFLAEPRFAHHHEGELEPLPEQDHIGTLCYGSEGLGDKYTSTLLILNNPPLRNVMSGFHMGPTEIPTAASTVPYYFCVSW